MHSEQLELVAANHLASWLTPGATIEGVNGRAFARPLKVVDVAYMTEEGYVEVAYKETKGQRYEGIRVFRLTDTLELADR